MKGRVALASIALFAFASLYAQTPPPPSPEVLAARAATTQSCQADIKSLCAGKEGHEALTAQLTPPPRCPFPRW